MATRKETRTNQIKIVITQKIQHNRQQGTVIFISIKIVFLAQKSKQPGNSQRRL